MFSIRLVRSFDEFLHLRQCVIFRNWPIKAVINGQSFEKMFDVAWSGDRKPNKWSGRVPAIKSTVDMEKATYTNDVGTTELKTVWTDPEFDASLHAFYYARVLRVMYMEKSDMRSAPVPTGAVLGGSGPPPLALGGIGYGRAVAIGLATLAIFAFGVYPQPVLASLQMAANHLIQIL